MSTSYELCRSFSADWSSLMESIPVSMEKKSHRFQQGLVESILERTLSAK